MVGYAIIQTENVSGGRRRFTVLLQNSEGKIEQQVYEGSNETVIEQAAINFERQTVINRPAQPTNPVRSQSVTFTRVNIPNV